MGARWGTQSLPIGVFAPTVAEGFLLLLLFFFFVVFSVQVTYMFG